MNLLLDSHLGIWWIEANAWVKCEWLEPMLDRSNAVCVSAASALEIEIKKRSGRLPFGPTLVEVAIQYRFAPVPVSASDAARAGSLKRNHIDPFDRMLVAQSLEHRMVLVTDDALLTSAPGIRTL